MHLYHGPPAGAEYLLLQHRNFTQVGGGDHNDETVYFFATAVSLYGEGYLQWENLIRRLIRQGMDVHAHTRLRPIDPWFQDVSEDTYFLGTPLDELFVHTYSPFDAHIAACNWLDLLASEGFNITAYLEQEAVLHSAQQQLTWATFHQHRRLVYQLGEKPHVSWDWSIDPSSRASTLRYEYKSMIFSIDLDGCDGRELAPWLYTWLDTWPFAYSQWYTEGLYWSACKEQAASKKSQIELEQNRRVELANSRAYRRLKKKATKFRRASRTKDIPKMPGAWPV